MKSRCALARLLLGLALAPITFTAVLNTSASSAISGLAIGLKDAVTPAAIHVSPFATFTVTNNGDSGPGSLRDAIDQANLAPGADLINFNAGLGTIDVGIITGQPLPVITEVVTIDGGFPRVELNGTFAGAAANGLEIAAQGVTVRGLVINRFSLNGISIQSDSCVIQDNFIGTDAAGTSALPNMEAGVRVDSLDNLIGGTATTERNVISGNAGSGIEMTIAQASDNRLQGNFIGTDVSGGLPLGNGGSGVRTLGGASFNIIGGTDPGAANTIAFNTGSGVSVFSGVNNAVLGNSIFSNGALGINLSDDPGVTPNDACDSDTGANNLQNFPVLTSATSNGATTIIIGSLDGEANTSFRIEFFSINTCDPSGFGEGATFIGSTNIMTDALCAGPINAVLPVGVPPGQVITATASAFVESIETSEFSECVTVTGLSGSDLQITKSDSPDPVVSGDNITYTIAVTNNGPDPDPDAMFADNLPAGTTFVSLTSPGTCTTPPVGGTGAVTCFLGPLSSGATIPITLVVNVAAAPGGFITNTATVSGMGSDPIPGNNSATASTGVFSGSCTLTCPPDLFASIPPNAKSCETVVTFSPTAFGCELVTCVPPSGSGFAVGTTTVSCSEIDGPSCSFTVTVVDESPPSITCSTGATAPLPAGQLSAVVDYPAPTATDCTATDVVCVPPSGSTFPPGATLITCTARDDFENTSRCFFFVTVLDAEPPVISCPANVSVLPAAGQTSAVVTYPAPTITDNIRGVTVACLPASGSSFPIGSTTVVCTATDAGGNKSSCSFQVGVGAAQLRVTIPGNKDVLEFAANPNRKTPKPKKNPCAFFTIENIGFAPLVLTFDSIERVGSDVADGSITDPNDSRFFTVSRVNSDQSLTQLEIDAVLALQPGQSQSLCAKFAALIPALAGKTTGLAASNVLPDTVTSFIRFKQNVGPNTFRINIIPVSARVSTALVLVNLSNPRALPEVLFTRSGNEITVAYAVFDSNLDVTRAKYEFLDASGQVVAGPFEIDLAASISSANLVRGQSFRVDQRFTGASSNPEITSVRLTVFDGETSASAPSTASATSISTASTQLMNRAGDVTLYPPVVRFR